MKLSFLTIDSIKEFISGDCEFTPYLTGPEILKMFNNVGFRDIYDRQNGGMPNAVSRNKYVFDKLGEINGTREMIKLVEMVFDPRHFVKNTNLDIQKAVDSFNQLISQDGYRLELIEHTYKIIGSDLPEQVEIEIHFEDIQKKIIEQVTQAKFTIWVAVAWFTDPLLFDLLLKKKTAGVNVQVIVFDDEINAKHGFPYEDHFETVRVKPSGMFKNIMHHKFCVIDLKVVTHGSYNWTNKARWNKETISVDISRELAEKFAAQFILLKTNK